MLFRSASAPRRGRRGAESGRGRTRGESWSAAGETTPTGGPRLSVGCGRGRPAGPEERKKNNGPPMGFWAAGRKKEKEGEGDGLGRPG